MRSVWAVIEIGPEVQSQQHSVFSVLLSAQTWKYIRLEKQSNLRSVWAVIEIGPEVQSQQHRAKNKNSPVSCLPTDPNF